MNDPDDGPPPPPASPGEDLRRTRLALRIARSRYRDLYERAPVACVTLDGAGRIVESNRLAAQLFRTTVRSLRGRALADFLHPAERDGLPSLLRHALHDGAHHGLDLRLAAGGEQQHWVALRIVAVADGGPPRYRAALIDISDRHRADRATHERLRHLEVLSHAGQMLILGDEDVGAMRRELFERVREAVGSDLRMTYGVDEGGQTISLLSWHGLDDAARRTLGTVRIGDTLCGLVVQRCQRLVLEQLPSSTLPQALQLQAMGVRCYAGFPLLAHGRLYGAAAFASTRRERFGEGDLLLIQTVCDQVSAMMERTRLLEELHASEQTLKQADRTKDDFIATLAHELRSPLAPIRNALGVLRQAPHSTPQQQAWCRDVIDRQVQQMTRLLEDLLDVSRLSRNKVALRRQRIELARAIEQAIEATQPLMDAQRHHFTLRLPAVPVWVEGDLMRLTQVFANLLGNAAKYSDPGGRIVLEAALEGGEVRISVSDSGIGIDARQLPRVFEMFAQLTPALGRSEGGLGIGLALAHGLVELHGGTMQARSAGIGHGSEFIVRLPVAPALDQPANEPAGEAPARPPAPRRRILVVDDHVDAAQTLAALLALHGHEVRAAFSGAEALAIVRDWRPEVGLLDIGMPGLNGYELCRALRAATQDTGGPPLLLVACTGWGQAADRNRARDAGFDRHLVKPVDLAAVLRLLEPALPAAVD